MTIFTPVDPLQKQREETQKALDKANAALYRSKKASSDQHPVLCDCETCDWVAKYEWMQEKLHPSVEPNYCFE